MNTSFDTAVRGTGRLAIAFGSALALACAIAIIKVAPTSIETPRPVEVVRLDPVVVTISKERFDAIRAETEQPSSRFSFFARLFAKRTAA